MAVSFTKMDEIPVDLTSLKRKTDKKSSREMCLREDPFFVQLSRLKKIPVFKIIYTHSPANVPQGLCGGLLCSFTAGTEDLIHLR